MFKFKKFKKIKKIKNKKNINIFYLIYKDKSFYNIINFFVNAIQ